ncbi:MAG TPA: hypothetical protein PKY88_07865 [Anaerohalosphaeraceae bacterium]|nr:hypothetical protein [Anaerohalosphaeraceae bacterium]
MSKDFAKSEPSFILHGQIDLPRLMKKPLGIKIAGIEPRADLYAYNGFRFLSIPASSDDRTLELASQKFRNLERLNRRAVHQMTIQIGYDSHLAAENPGESVRRLRDPHYRMLDGFFWPHLNLNDFDVVVRHHSLVNEAVCEHFLKIAGCQDSRRQLLARHALAITYHNLALQEEINILQNNGTEPGRMWEKALQQWAVILQSKEFWNYLNEWAQQWADWRLGTGRLDGEFKMQIAQLILSFPAFFIRSYARLGRRTLCLKHLELIQRSEFPQEAKQATLIQLAKSLALEWLKPLLARLSNPEGEDYLVRKSGVPTSKCPKCGFGYGWDDLEGSCSHCGVKLPKSPNSKQLHSAKNSKSTERKTFPAKGLVSWLVFSDFYEPLFEDALSTRAFLKDELGLPEEAVEQAEFDAFGESLLDAMEKRIDLGQERERAILYTLILYKKLLQLPLSNATRQRIRELKRARTQLLYGDLEVPKDLDPTECWFLPGQTADPCDSIVLPFYKIIYEDIIEYQWNTKRILVPRCSLAAKHHNGKIRAEELRDDPALIQLKEQKERIEEKAHQQQKALQEQLEKILSDI